MEDITADNKRVIRECKEELAEPRTKIDEYVAGLEPGAARTSARSPPARCRRSSTILDKDIAKKEEELQNKLKDKQAAAIKAIDEKIEKMKEAMSGALAKVGRLLLWAAKKFFTWALEKFGFSLSTIESIIDKGIGGAEGDLHRADPVREEPDRRREAGLHELREELPHPPEGRAVRVADRLPARA